MIPEAKRICKLRYKKEGSWWLHRGDRGSQSFRYRQRYPLRHRIACRIYRALKKGILKKPKCCQLCHRNYRPLEAHHSDYRRPFFILWVDSKCHLKIHKKSVLVKPVHFNSTRLVNPPQSSWQSRDGEKIKEGGC